MRFRLILPLIALLALLCAPAVDGKSRYRVGISDQNFQMFHQSAFQELGLKRVRYIVPWNGIYDSTQVGEMDAFLGTAAEYGFEPFITFNPPRHCYTAAGKRRKVRSCAAPKVRKYKRAVKAFRARYPQVRVFAPWNEVNHHSQPTYRKPRLAAKYYNAMRKVCRGCTLVAADVLDQSGVGRYLRKFQRKAKGSPRRWGLHNYGDVNRKRTARTREVLRAVPGEVWLTETGGIVKFLSFKYSERRAGKRIRYMFKLADRYDTRRRGMRSKITRLYYYQWTGAPRGTRFDAGLTDPDGSVRRHYSTFRSQLSGKKR